MGDTLKLKGNDGNWISIAFLHYEQKDAPHKDDQSWISGEISIYANPFSGKFKASFRAGGLKTFLRDLQNLYDGKISEVSFANIEGDLSLDLEADNRGSIVIGGIAGPAISSIILSFGMESDQTFLKESISELKEIVKKYPER